MVLVSDPKNKIDGQGGKKKERKKDLQQKYKRHI